ncbi:MAG: superoxide dismutase [Chitinivibrionales bacterium]|nr:superoxide dismutase [Chitinivibrionales bacterium]MBD3396468.1 superoxide dismutase [Chitinivibrionales bacterium]
MLHGHLGAAYAAAQKKSAGLTFPDLPYEVDALAPYLSARTVGIHYKEHHKGYYDLVAGWVKKDAGYQGKSLEELIGTTRGGILRDESVFHMAVLLYNHNLYWPSMKPDGGGEPSTKLDVRGAVEKSFGSYKAFRKKFVEEAMKLGSGWVFLVNGPDGLAVFRTDYHDTPLHHYFTPLLALDVWEHAYYLDYQNNRRKYVDTFFDKLVNWQFAESRLKQTRRK